MHKVTLFVLFAFAVLFSPTCVKASTLFYDDFSETGLAKWQLSIGDTAWNVVDKRLQSTVFYRQQSYLLAKDTFGYTDYQIDVDVENVSGIDQHFIFRAKQDLSEFYQLELRYPDSAWPQDPAANVRLWRYKNGGYTRLEPDTPFQLEKGSVFHLKIVVVGSNIKVYVNGVLVIDNVDNDSILSGGFGFHAYAGDYRPGSVVNLYDNLRIVTTGSTQNKIIILPGLGGSWNTEAMVYNTPVADDAWKITPFAKNYDGLINTLVKKGLVQNKDFFVWPYDWRRPASEIVDKLNTFIDQKIATGEKVDLVGHSFGGVISRIWAQDNATNPKLGKVISLGSPQNGAMVAYDWWNGTKSVAGSDPASVALALVYQLSRRNAQSDIEVLRNFSPSLKDLLPTYNFVVKNNVLVDSTTLVTKNDYLKSKNTNAGASFDSLKAVVGIGQNTNEKVVVGERSVFDKVLSRWPDGVPLRYITGQGDGTVIKNSAKFDGDVYEEVTSNHGEIVDRSIDRILAELGIGGTSNEPVYRMNNGSIFFIGSPAYLQVNCGGSTLTSDETGFVVVNNNAAECKVVVVGTGDGTYHLVAGKTDDSNGWRYFEDNISVGSSKVLLIDNKGYLKTDTVNLNYLYDSVKYDLQKLQVKYPGNANLAAAMTAANAKNVNNLVTYLFSFRKEKKESLLSGAIVGNVETILRIENRNLSLTVIKAAYTKALQDKSLVDRMTRLYVVRGRVPTTFGAESYKKLEYMMNQNGLDYAKSVLASKLAGEVW